MTKTIQRECALCGGEFTVEIDEKTGNILTNCFYGGKIRLGIGMWSHSQAVQNPDGSLKLDEEGRIVWKRCHPWWRELYFRLIDLKRLLLHQYWDIEYWECPLCLKKASRDSKGD